MPPQKLPNEDYPTKNHRLGEDSKNPEEQTTQRSDQEFENPVDPSEIPEEPPEIPEESEGRFPEGSQKIQIGLPERPEEPVDTPEESTDVPDESTIWSEEPTERLEEPTERPDEPTEKLETSTEIPEESKRIYMTERPNLPKLPDYSVKFDIDSNKYDEVTSKKQNIYFSPRPVEEITGESSYTTFTPPINNNVPRYKSTPVNQTSYTTYKKQEIIKESKMYIDNSFQEPSSKFNANRFIVLPSY